MSFDLAGAARDLDAMARRYVPLYKMPDVEEATRLLHRNPAIAPDVRRFIEARMAELPGGGVGLDVPLFNARGELAQREGA